MYLDNEQVEKEMQILDFVKLYLKSLGITQEEFATIFKMKSSNLHKYFTSERKLNPDIVMKLSSFSHTQPELWYAIQTKNALSEFKTKKIGAYKSYDYEKLSSLLSRHRIGN